MRIWAELNGAVRPDLWDARRAWLATTRIAVIYEVLLGGGVPRSTLPVLALIVMALLTLYGWGISAFIHILNDSSTMNADQKTE